jgi:hypothetical protein
VKDGCVVAGRRLCQRLGEAFRTIFAAITGNGTEPLSDEDLAALDRVILEITCARVYGASYLPAAG